MDIRIILSIIMATLMLSWVIGTAIAFFIHEEKTMRKEDYIFHVVCTKCNTAYDATCEDVIHFGASKQLSVTKTKRDKTILYTAPQYKCYSKKVMCPCCKKRVYANILNINDFNERHRGKVLKDGMKYMVIMAIGGMAIILLFKIPFSIADQATKKHIEEMRQQQYDDLIHKIQNNSY